MRTVASAYVIFLFAMRKSPLGDNLKNILSCFDTVDGELAPNQADKVNLNSLYKEISVLNFIPPSRVVQPNQDIILKSKLKWSDLFVRKDEIFKKPGTPSGSPKRHSEVSFLIFGLIFFVSSHFHRTKVKNLKRNKKQIRVAKGEWYRMIIIINSIIYIWIQFSDFLMI